MGFLRKVLKKVTKGLRKAVKSKFGKLLLVGAALYLGGAFGAAKGAASGAAQGATAAAAPAAAGEAAATTAAASSTAAAAPTAVAGGGVAGTTALPEIVMEGATQKASGGILGKAIKGIGGFVEKNPMASSMMFNAAASALSPDETELLEKQEKMRRQRWQDMEVPESVGFAPSNRGIINGGMR